MEQYANNEKIKRIYKSLNIKFNQYEEIDLNDFSNNHLLNVNRQLKRFVNWVCNLDYKLSIFENNNLCVINENNQIYSYQFINDVNLETTRQFFINVKLSYFFKHLNEINIKINKIYNEIYKNLLNNFNEHISNYQDNKNIYNIVKTIENIDVQLKNIKQTCKIELRNRKK